MFLNYSRRSTTASINRPSLLHYRMNKQCVNQILADNVGAPMFRSRSRCSRRRVVAISRTLTSVLKGMPAAASRSRQSTRGSTPQRESRPVDVAERRGCLNLPAGMRWGSNCGSPAPQRITAPFNRMMEIAAEAEGQRFRSCRRHRAVRSNFTLQCLQPVPAPLCDESREAYMDTSHLATRQNGRLRSRPVYIDQTMECPKYSRLKLERDEAQHLRRWLVLSSMKRTFLCSTFHRFDKVLDVFKE